MINCALKPMTAKRLENLFQYAKEDADWPRSLMTSADRQVALEQCQAYQMLGYGGMYAVEQHREVIGMATLEIVTSPLPEMNNVVVFEGGTHLLPDVRGQGINQQVKHALENFAEHEFRASYLIFTIEESNQRAIAAFNKLSPPYGAVHSRSVKTELFFPLCKYRSYQRQSPCIIFHRALQP